MKRFRWPDWNIVGIIRSMMKMHHRYIIALIISGIFIAGCTNPQPTVQTPTLPPATAAPPTATSVPIAASVNGEPILLSDFEDEVARFEDAKIELGIDLATLNDDYRQHVLQALIDRRLLSLGARNAGNSISQAVIDERIEELSYAHGGTESLNTWLAANHYTSDSFRAALNEDLLAAIMVSEITAGVPREIEQAHARHILVADKELAEVIHNQLLDGADFAILAQTYSLDLSTRPAGGDLSWFAPGTLTMPEVEEAAFGLEADEISDVVQSPLGYHLVQVIERGVRPLAPRALQLAKENAVEAWIASQYTTVEVEIVTIP